jgi:hypothetical protein
VLDPHATHAKRFDEVSSFFLFLWFLPFSSSLPSFLLILVGSLNTVPPYPVRICFRWFGWYRQSVCIRILLFSFTFFFSVFYLLPCSFYLTVYFPCEKCQFVRLLWWQNCVTTTRSRLFFVVLLYTDKTIFVAASFFLNPPILSVSRWIS